MGATLSIHVGRLQSHPRGGFEIHLPDGEIVMGPNGRGLTAIEAEEALAYIENRSKEIEAAQLVAGE